MNTEEKHTALIISAILFAAMSIAMAIFSPGCATTKPEARVESPCIGAVPPMAKIELLGRPEPVEFPDGEGGSKHGIKITAETKSVSDFFGWVTSLQDIAKRALSCVKR